MKKSKFQLIWRGKEVSKAIDRISHERLEILGDLLETEIKKTLSKKGTGRTYTRRGRVHVASAPGKSPVIWYGGLVGSIYSIVTSVGSMDLLNIGTPEEYGPALEFGTEDMAARPWLGKTLEASRPMIKAFVEKEWF